jgi:aspartyl protease family protein
VGQVAWVGLWSVFSLYILMRLVSAYRGRLGQAAAQALVWVFLFLIAALAYSYRDAFGDIEARLVSELEPGNVSQPAPGEAMVVRGLDGEFVLRARIDGATVPLIFDTGASTIELRAEDADRIGLPVSRLAYEEHVDTANGPTTAAPVTLGEVSVGGIVVRRVAALVARPGALRESLLGRSFLDRLQGYSVERSRLILKGRR